MTGILEKISSNVRIRNARTDLHLEFLRFRKFLRNIRDVVGIIEDGKDKLQEEYIFDGHYVLSLVDDILENTGFEISEEFFHAGTFQLKYPGGLTLTD